jgi:hypothetical protein
MKKPYILCQFFDIVVSLPSSYFCRVEGGVWDERKYNEISLG